MPSRHLPSAPPASPVRAVGVSTLLALLPGGGAALPRQVRDLRPSAQRLLHGNGYGPDDAVVACVCLSCGPVLVPTRDAGLERLLIRCPWCNQRGTAAVRLPVTCASCRHFYPRGRDPSVAGWCGIPTRDGYPPHALHKCRDWAYRA